MKMLGLDVGGANIKGANADGVALQQPFELWKNPSGLSSALGAFLARFPPFDSLAVTMTGELCDCFATKREGVNRILDSVTTAAPGIAIKIWQTTGRFTNTEQARASYLATAAANWHALASWAGRLVPDENALLIDIGSTTTDIIPIRAGKPASIGLTDQDRLKSKELLYTGVNRTPLCALLGMEGAAEWFASTLDIYLMLGKIPEHASANHTADGRPATIRAAHARLARMMCGDSETCSMTDTTQLAQKLAGRQALAIRKAVEIVACSLPMPPTAIILSGSGEFLAHTSLPSFSARVISLSKMLGADLSRAACAYALAVLANQ